MAVSSNVTGLTPLQGCLSVANILLGAGLLSIPYAMTLSGWSGVLVIALCCILFNTSGKFISWGLDLLPPGIAHGYPELGYAAFGASGRHMVTLAAVLELFGGACMELLIFWRSLEQLLPAKLLEGWLPAWMTLEGVALLTGFLIQVPLCLWGTFKSLSYFSAAGVLSTCSVMVMVAALPFLDPNQVSLQEDTRHHTIGTGVFSATGIMALSVAGHSTFPSVRARMADATLFPAALDGAYAITCIVACSIGGVGYWYWGDSAQILVTDDFENHSPYMTWHVLGIGIHHIVQALVALNVGTTVPLLLLPLVDILQSVLATARHDADSSNVATDGGYEPLLPDPQPPCSHAFPLANHKPLRARQLSVSAHPIAAQFLRDRGSKAETADSSGDKATEPHSPFMHEFTPERAGMFSPRSRDVLEHLSPRRRDVLLRAFPVAIRGHSVASSVSMTFTDAPDFDQQQDDDQVKALAAEAFWLRLFLLTGLGAFSALTRHSLDSVESVVGAVCVVFSSLLLPTVFYVGMRWQRKTDSVILWAGGSFMLLFGGGLMTLIVVQTVLKVVGVDL